MTTDLLTAALDEVHCIRFSDTPVPKRIHMTARSKQLEGEFLANQQRIEALNPGWVVVVHDDEDIERFIGSAYGPATLALYRSLNKRYGAARADLFRYLCLYSQGGVYLDLKSTTTRPLDDWITPQDRFIISQWDNKPDAKYSGWGLYPELAQIPGGEYQQWFIVTAAGHPFLAAVIKRVLGNIAHYRPLPPRFGRLGVINVTGPVAYTLAIHPLLSLHSHRLLDVENAQRGGLRYSIFDNERAHYTLNQVHYSQLAEPIVALGAFNMRLFQTAQALQLHLQAFKRRLIALLVQLKKRATG